MDGEKEVSALNRFDAQLAAHALPPLRARQVTTLQVNVGKVCNQTCAHCHVDAGPHRTESMTRDTAEHVIRVLRENESIRTLDITGGAPELNANFRWLAIQARSLGRHVIDRCNLTVFFVEGQRDLPTFLAEHRVEVVASLPCYTSENVDKQRGKGVFNQSLDALKKLNDLGYGRDDSGLVLNLVYNPLGASLPPPQAKLEADYKRELKAKFDIVFNHLFTITNMPISRFETDLVAHGKHDVYMDTLTAAFNSSAVNDVMCRDLISVGWDGQLFDCDFNQMLDLPLMTSSVNIADFSTREFSNRLIRTDSHCLGCTAGAGSSCGGVLK
ncbi:MAG: arsenosugar biosynthesis radical SAM (seleno)protein ArsS [Planctomycetota bacterium]